MGPEGGGGGVGGGGGGPGPPMPPSLDPPLRVNSAYQSMKTCYSPTTTTVGIT